MRMPQYGRHSLLVSDRPACARLDGSSCKRKTALPASVCVPEDAAVAAVAWLLLSALLDMVGFAYVPSLVPCCNVKTCCLTVNETRALVHGHWRLTEDLHTTHKQWTSTS